MVELGFNKSSQKQQQSSQSSANANSSYNSGASQSIYGAQDQGLKSLYEQLAGLFGQGKNQNAQLQPGAQKYMNQIAGQGQQGLSSQLGGGAYSGVNANDVYNSIQGSMGQPSNASSIYAQMMGGQGNNYADAMKAQYMKDANKAQGQMLSNLDARAAGAGMMGSSRQGVAQGLGMQGINDSLQSQLAQTGYNTFDQDLQNKLGIAQQADSNTMGRQGMLMDMLAGKQNSINTGMMNTAPVQNLGMGQYQPGQMDWQNILKYIQGIGDPTVLNKAYNTGKSTASQQASAQGSGSANAIGANASVMKFW